MGSKLQRDHRIFDSPVVCKHLTIWSTCEGCLRVVRGKLQCAQKSCRLFAGRRKLIATLELYKLRSLGLYEICPGLKQHVGRGTWLPSPGGLNGNLERCVSVGNLATFGSLPEQPKLAVPSAPQLVLQTAMGLWPVMLSDLPTRAASDHFSFAQTSKNLPA